MKSKTLLEAKRLYDLGFAIIWLHPNGKRPIESGWTTGPRTSWKDLKESYQIGNNVGVRTGTPSKIGEEYLAVIDVDIKKPEFEAKALAKVKELVGGPKCPVVFSGSGNGSRHFYCTTKSPFKMITALKEDGGEVCIYSDGRQMVVPPSKTVKPYKWAWQLDHIDELPSLDFSSAAAPSGKLTVKKLEAGEVIDDVKFSKVDLEWLPISDAVRDAIISGKGVEDRSGYLLQATTALHSAGLERDEILSVLTDPNTYLGKCAYEHAKTTKRAVASQWLFKYTVKKVLGERSAEEAFKDAPKTAPPRALSAKELSKQNREMAEELDWKADIVRVGPKADGPPKCSVENVVLILTKAVGEKLATRNLFAYRDTYGINTPWGGKKDELLTDDDVVEIKYWLGQQWRFEPSNNTISEALIILARKNGYDPVCDWLDSLEKWDGKPRLGTWLVDNFEAEGSKEYLSQVFTKWLVAMVMRAKMPGSKFDWFPVFEGPQGVGKSSFGRLLVGDKVFLDSLPNLADKDAALSLQGIWGVEMGELANMRRTEIEIVKAFITRTVDKVRAPYGKRWIESPRRCVFFGTTNRSTYLTDDTGNRRIKPLKVGNLDFEVLRRDRHQLFAEAIAIFEELKQGVRSIERYFELTGEAKVFEAQVHGEKMVEDDSDTMVEQLQIFFEKTIKNGAENFCFEKFQLADLFQGMAPLHNWSLNSRNMQFAAKALKKLGGKNWKSDGRKVWKITKEGWVFERGVPDDFY